MEKALYLELRAKHTKADGEVDWKAYNADPAVLAAKGKAPKASKTPKASNAKHGPVVTVVAPPKAAPAPKAAEAPKAQEAKAFATFTETGKAVITQDDWRAMMTLALDAKDLHLARKILTYIR